MFYSQAQETSLIGRSTPNYILSLKANSYEPCLLETPRILDNVSVVVKEAMANEP